MARPDRCAWCTTPLPKRQPAHTNLCPSCYGMSADPRQGGLPAGRVTMIVGDESRQVSMFKPGATYPKTLTHCPCGARLGINEPFGKCTRCYLTAIRSDLSKVYGQEATISVYPMHDNSPQRLDNDRLLTFGDSMDNGTASKAESIRRNRLIYKLPSICRHHAFLAASRVRAWVLPLWCRLWLPVRSKLRDAAVWLLSHVYVGPLVKPLTQFIVGKNGQVIHAEQLWPKQRALEPIVITQGAMLFAMMMTLVCGFIIGLLW